MATRLKRITATGLITAAPARLKSVVLTPAAAVATLVIDDSTDGSGTDLFSLQAGASGASVIWMSADSTKHTAGVGFSVGIHATLGGTGASAMIEYE
jgi:hypothetical protein